MRRCTTGGRRLARLGLAILAATALLAILFVTPTVPAGAEVPPLSGTLTLDEPEGKNPDTHGTVAYEVSEETATITFVIDADDGDGESPLTVTEVQYCDLATPINWAIQASTCAGHFRDAGGDPMEGEEPQILDEEPWVFVYDPAEPYWTLHVVAGGRTLYVMPGEAPDVGSISLTKTDDSTPPVALAGAVFRLTGPNAYSQDKTTDSAGKAFWGNLPAGTYTMTEISVPAGYATLANSAGGLASGGQFTVPSGEGASADWSIEVTVKNHKIPDGPPPPVVPEFGSLRVLKTGFGDDELAGAEFTLFTDVFPTGGTRLVGDVPTAMKATTNSDGVATISGIPFGNYWLVETVVPAGYEALADRHVVVTNTQQLTFDLENEPLDSGIAIVKSGPAKAHVGDTVTYTFAVTNTGDLNLSDVELEDEMLDAAAVLVDDGDGDVLLEVDEVWTYTGTHVVTAEDADPLANSATVSGEDMFGRTPDDSDDHEVDLIHPAIEIVKTASPTSAALGTTVTYTYVVTNTGDTALFDVEVTDDKLGAIGTIEELAAGASQTLTKAVVLAAGAAATNVGTATGADELGKVVTDTDDATITIVAGEQIIRPDVLPRTGEPIDLMVVGAMSLIVLGAMALAAARFRRNER